MRILVACEESQAVTIELRELGHEAYSCDIEPCSGGHPEWHLQVDALELLKMKWDMIIAHPPCTYLSNAGAARLYPSKGELNQERYEKGLKAKEFFLSFLNADCPRIAVENPIPTRVYGLPTYNQIIQPYEFGHPYSKKTCLWLKGLPKLRSTDLITANIVSWVSGGSKDSHGNPRKQSGTKIRDAKTRSKTFPGIAKAMAEQWTGNSR
ncbi:DNA cytosine methyltransferase [Lacrimispora sp.]|uniref:DNA cytosine methyltransferase n=1 Tax=Lacrimispora sp. TaxID=2719234 RepID=UPI0028AD3B7B|nr:DNA cytosine methyltransferase [Lacrimispora sp.]